MSDGEVEVEAPQSYPVLPKEVTNEIGSTKLFNKWSYEDVEIRDISLTYVAAVAWNTCYGSLRLNLRGSGEGKQC